MEGAPTNLVLALLAEFASDMRQAKSINQIALSSGKPYANVHAAATALIKEDILLKETIGHSHLCRLNLSNDKTLIYVSLLETLKRDELLRRSQNDILLLTRIDALSHKLGILLAWKIKDDTRAKDSILIITTTHQPHASDIIGTATTAIPLAAFLSDVELRSTISGKGTLLFGHALYVSILKEQPVHRQFGQFGNKSYNRQVGARGEIEVRR